MTGASMEHRGARTAEYVRVLRAIWGEQPVEFSGDFYTVPRGAVLPRPIQPGGPPVLLGGTAPVALRRAGRISDGWVTSSRADLAGIAGSIRRARRRGRCGPGFIRAAHHLPSGSLSEAHDEAGHRRLLSGHSEQIREDLTWLGRQGVTEVFCDLNWDPLVGAPDADPAAATDRAATILAALAPAS